MVLYTVLLFFVVVVGTSEEKVFAIIEKTRKGIFHSEIATKKLKCGGSCIDLYSQAGLGLPLLQALLYISWPTCS